MPHAWLIGGPRGIGKATLAYRMARFVFAHPDPASAAVQHATLALPPGPSGGAPRRRAGPSRPARAGAHRGRQGQAARPSSRSTTCARTIGFFGSTAGEGGWRICIVDCADELNAAGANALLKILEEPPAKSLLLVVSHAPGRLLPTIRSRCRRLALRPLAPEDVARAVADALRRDADEADIKAAAAASDGSVARALDLLGGTALQVRERVNAMLAALPAVNPRELHALGDALGRATRRAFTAFVDAVRDWLARPRHGRGRGARAARAHRRGVGQAQRRARDDDRVLQSRRESRSGFQRVRLACRAAHARFDAKAAMAEQAPLLHHDRDRVSERRAAYRPRLRGHRDRRDRALQAARRLRRVLPHRHRRARHQDAADRRPRRA